MDRRGVEGQDRRSVDGRVAQQDRARNGGSPGERPLGWIVDRLLRLVGRALVGLRAVGEDEEVADETVDLRLGDLAALDGRHELVAVDTHRARHLEVQPRVRRARRVVDAVPVGHDEAVEAPLVAQDLRQQSAVVGTELAVEAVVGAHDPPRVAVLHGEFERAQIELAEGAFVDVDVDAHPLDLGVVRGEVLDRDGHVVRLHATDVGRSQRAGEFGVFAVALERATADGGPMQVDGGAQHDVRALAARLGADQRSDLTDEPRIPGGAECDAGRDDDAGCARPAVALAAYPVGAVRHLQLRHAGIGEGMRPPGRAARHECALVVQRECGQCRIDIDHPPSLTFLASGVRPLMQEPSQTQSRRQTAAPARSPSTTAAWARRGATQSPTRSTLTPAALRSLYNHSTGWGWTASTTQSGVRVTFAPVG